VITRGELSIEENEKGAKLGAGMYRYFEKFQV
jgi:hypothetical protein